MIGLVWDGIGRGWGREGVGGDRVAHDGVAIQGVLVYEEGGVGHGLWPYLLEIIFDKYGSIFILFL